MSGSDSGYSSPEEKVTAQESSSDFDSEFSDSTDSEDKRRKEAQAQAAAYRAHRDEVAKVRNLRQSSRVIEDSDEGSDASTDSSQASDHKHSRRVLSRGAKTAATESNGAVAGSGALLNLNASSTPAMHSGSMDGSKEGPASAAGDDADASPAQAAQAQHTSPHSATCCGLVDFWATAALMQALQRACRLPKLDLVVSSASGTKCLFRVHCSVFAAPGERLDRHTPPQRAVADHGPTFSEAVHQERKVVEVRHDSPTHCTASRTVCVCARSDKTWFRSLGRIMANDEHDWLFQGIEEQFNVQLDSPSFDWHKCSLLLRLHILRALLESQLLVNATVQCQLAALLALQEAQADHDEAVEAALSAVQAKIKPPSASAQEGDEAAAATARQDALKGNVRVASALKALDKAQQEHEEAFAVVAPSGPDEGWGVFGFEWPIPPGSRRTPHLPMAEWSRKQLQSADAALLKDNAGWRYVLLSDSAGGVRFGRWRHRMCKGQLSPLREAQMAALQQVYQQAHEAAAAAAAAAATEAAGIVDDDSSGDSGGGGGGGGTLTAFFKHKTSKASKAQASLSLRTSMLLGGGSDSEEGRAEPKPAKLPTLPIAFVPAEAAVATRIEQSRTSVVRMSLLRSAVACGVADADRLPELGGAGGGSASAAPYEEGEVEAILGQMHVQFRPQLPAWLQAELAGEVPTSLYGLGSAQAEMLCHSLQQLRALAGTLAPPAEEAVFEQEEGSSGDEASEPAQKPELQDAAVTALLAQLLHLSPDERVQLGTALRVHLLQIEESQEEQAEAVARAEAKAERIARTMAMLGAPRSSRRGGGVSRRAAADGSSDSQSEQSSSGSVESAAGGAEGGLIFDSSSASSASSSSSEGSDAEGAAPRPLKQRRSRGSKRSLNVDSLAAFAYMGSAVPARNKRRATRQPVSYTVGDQFKDLDEAMDDS